VADQNDTGSATLWSAGQVTPCDGGSKHGPANFNVTVRCVCGAAFMSTDAGIALGMAQQHAEEHQNGRSD
jgi:hypothetical protein